MGSITHINSYFIASSLHSELVVALDKKGIAQQVFVPVEKACHINKNEPAKLQFGKIYYSHCFNTSFRYLWPVKMYLIWKAFKKHFLAHPTKLIHAHTLIVNGLIAYFAHRKWNVPYIVSVRHTDMKIFMGNFYFFRIIGYRILKNSKAIIFLSPAYRETQLKAILGDLAYEKLKQKSYVLPNGINEFWINNRNKKKELTEQHTIIFVGSVVKRKNLKALINACEILKNEDFKIRLLVVGDGDQLSYFKSQTYKTEIIFYGFISKREQLRNIYKDADLLVLPSLLETFGLVYPEAMSQGLPVIYTRGQGFDGHYPDGHVGYAINPNDPRDIAEKIKVIFSDYLRFSTNAFNASLDFSWDKIVDKLLEVYSKH